MLINPNTVAQNMPVTINGDQMAATGTQYLTSLTADPVQSTASGLGNSFTASIPGRSIMVLILSPVPIPGDYNNDGIVDAADYTVWRGMAGQSGANLAADGTGPDGTPDGVVDDLDYQFWADRFGNTSAGSGAGATSAVPEPSTLTMVAVGIMALIGVRGIRHR
jgi:hypothetical protein